MFKVIVSYMLLGSEELEEHFNSVDEVKEWAFNIGEDKFLYIFVEDEFGEVFIEEFDELMEFA